MFFDTLPRAAATHPDAASFRDPKDALTFAEMADKTARLAALLRAHGLQEGDRVAIYMPSSVLTALSVHGVFRAGGAFVPVDPDAPKDRVRTILSDCGVRHVLTLPALAENLPYQDLALIVGTNALPWDTVWQTEPATDLPSRDPERLAYVMYTSGSTGTPKGIAHSHRSGLAYVRYSADTYGVGPGDVLATTGPLHFDVSTFIYLTAPWAAASAVIVPQPYTRMPASMAGLFAETGVTIFYTTASALTGFVDRGALDKHDLSALRWALFCGEPMPPAQLARAMAALPACWFSNSYGPAEVNQCTFKHFPPGTNVGAMTTISIGATWDGARALLIEGGKPTDEGELVIASDTMMHGYWNRPDLEERAYFHDTDGTRYYRTGDLARLDAQGDFDLLGRVDRQIKLRGYRVELDEIEVTLASHPDVREAGVYPIHDGDAVTGIGAVVLARSGTSADTLRRYLAERLPPYALPTHLTVAEALPRTSSGKIDRRRLALDHEKKTETVS